MAWSAPVTKATGDLVTAAAWNEQIANNMLALAAGARVYHSAAQSIANTTTTVLAFDSERYDTDVIHDTATNNSRLTCKTAGKYLITAHIDWDGAVAGARSIQILLNGTTIIAADFDASIGAGGMQQSISTVYALAVNDYVEVQVFQSSGGALEVNRVDAYSPEFSMHFQGG